MKVSKSTKVMAILLTDKEKDQQPTFSSSFSSHRRPFPFTVRVDFWLKSLLLYIYNLYKSMLTFCRPTTTLERR